MEDGNKRGGMTLEGLSVTLIQPSSSKRQGHSDCDLANLTRTFIEAVTCALRVSAPSCMRHHLVSLLREA